MPEQATAGVRRPTLLLVNEHKIMREGIAELVKRDGDFEVIGDCALGTEAVHVFRSRRADVIVMGSRLQDLDGIQATRLVLWEFPTAKIVLLSALENQEAILWAMRSGAMALVLESSSSNHLFDALRAVAGNHFYIDPNASDMVVNSLRRQDMEVHGRSADALSCRELELLSLLMQGKTSKEIATLLSLSVETVRSYRKAMMKKLGVNNVAGLFRFAFQTGLMQLPVDRFPVANQSSATGTKAAFYSGARVGPIRRVNGV